MTTIRLTMAQALIRYLAAQTSEVDGCEVPLFAGVFAIFGHGNVAGVGEALYDARERLPTLRAHNEQAMGLAAIAFAKANRRRRMMACTSSIGPGATNMVTAAAVAHANRLPLLLLPGDVFASRRPDPVLQQVEAFGDPTASVNDCFRPVSRWWDRITRPEQILDSLPQALRVLTDPADCGPATLALPQDVQTEAYAYPGAFFASRCWRFRQPPPDPTLVADAVRTLSLKALYLPDQERILLDYDVPEIKHRWNEAHEIGHDITPWHAGMMLGDSESELTPSCHAQMEAEANYAAGQLLFLASRFVAEAGGSSPSLEIVRQLKDRFGNTITSTLWHYVEQVRPDLPMVGLVKGHPHRSRRKADFDPTDPCRYCVQSPSFALRFGHITEVQLFQCIARYCGAQRGGSLGNEEIVLHDASGEAHVFYFETFFNKYEALTLGVWQRPAPIVAFD
jgi:hypothetical protein